MGEYHELYVETIHYRLLTFLKTSEISILEYMNYDTAHLLLN